MTAPRYALYYAPPPESPLWTFGSAILGYDAATGAMLTPLAPEGVPAADWSAITAQPRRYGFHATLKAPFRLRDGVSEEDLIEAGHAFARRRKAFALPRLSVSPLETFAALSPIERSDRINDFASACVEAFEPFRAEPSPEELARRLGATLTGRQRENLDRWGYPYVFEDFHFHMTLTGSLSPERVGPIVEGLASLYDEHVGQSSTRFDAVTLYVEEEPSDGFRIVDRFVFGCG